MGSRDTSDALVHHYRPVNKKRVTTNFRRPNDVPPLAMTFQVPIPGIAERGPVHFTATCSVRSPTSAKEARRELTPRSSEGAILVDHQFSHLDAAGKLRMVDISGKRKSLRTAMARCLVVTTADLTALGPRDDEIDPALCARIAGVAAAKRTAELIPLCHTLNLSDVNVELTQRDRGVEVSATVVATQSTGVEMEALTACALAALSIVGSLATHDPSAWIDELVLLKKEGGRSGSWGRLTEDA